MLRVGTSAFTAAGWPGSFYPAHLKPAEYLSHYAQHFDTVEVDSTFYRSPSAATVKGWQTKTPDGFLFAAAALIGLLCPARQAQQQDQAQQPCHRYPISHRRLPAFRRPTLLSLCVVNFLAGQAAALDFGVWRSSWAAHRHPNRPLAASQYA
jgi:hypothetical protein